LIASSTLDSPSAIEKHYTQEYTSAQVYEYTAVNRLRNRIKGPVSAMAVNDRMIWEWSSENGRIGSAQEVDSGIIVISE